MGTSTIVETSGVAVLHEANATTNIPIKNKPVRKPFNFFTINLPYILGHFAFMTRLIANLYPDYSNMLWRLYEDLMNTRPVYACRTPPPIGRLKHGTRTLYYCKAGKVSGDYLKYLY
jgi:hypothetical protein